MDNRQFFGSASRLVESLQEPGDLIVLGLTAESTGAGAVLVRDRGEVRDAFVRVNGSWQRTEHHQAYLEHLDVVLQADVHSMLSALNSLREENRLLRARNEELQRALERVCFVVLFSFCVHFLI